MMPGVNYVKYGCSSARTTPGVSLYRSLTPEENIVAVITQGRANTSLFIILGKLPTLNLPIKSHPSLR